jgi:hypothetical protein
MARSTQAIRKPQQQQARLPMPTGGVNYVNGPLDFPPSDAYLIDNMIPKQQGIEIRKGWRYWCPNPAFAGFEVRTIMPYRAADPATDKLFCSPSSNGAIYDITTQGSAPVLAKTPTSAPTIFGEWSYTQFVTPANSYLLAVSAGAGYFYYSAAGGWVEAGNGTGAGQVGFPDSTLLKDIAFVFTWKARVWFLKVNSTVAYYLPVNSITGIAQLFDFGPLLKQGGPLAIGMSWTYDAGDGIDDSLIIVSFQGDVLLYEGTDPAFADKFALKGIWYAGRLPVGRRGFCQHGGNTLLLTEYGLVAISDLVAGKLHSSQLTESFGYKVNPNMSMYVSDLITSKYWYLTVFPVEEILVLGSPLFDNIRGIRQSFVMNSLNSSWCTVSEMDIYCADVFKGQFIFGTRNGNVCQGFTGYRDGVSADATDLGTETTGRMQGSFNGYGQNTLNKRMLRVKVYGVSDGAPSIGVVYKAEYDLKTLLSVNSPALTVQNTWDSALWDVSSWDVGATSFHKWIGVSGFGKMLSFQLAIRGSGRTILTDFEALYEIGLNL